MFSRYLAKQLRRFGNNFLDFPIVFRHACLFDSAFRALIIFSVKRVFLQKKKKKERKLQPYYGLSVKHEMFPYSRFLVWSYFSVEK